MTIKGLLHQVLQVFLIALHAKLYLKALLIPKKTTRTSLPDSKAKYI